jgi:hypothetical protein
MVPWLVSTVLATISDMVANGYLLLHKKVGPSQVSELFHGKVFLDSWTKRRIERRTRQRQRKNLTKTVLNRNETQKYRVSTYLVF